MSLLYHTMEIKDGNIDLSEDEAIHILWSIHETTMPDDESESAQLLDDLSAAYSNTRNSCLPSVTIKNFPESRAFLVKRILKQEITKSYL